MHQNTNRPRATDWQQAGSRTQERGGGGGDEKHEEHQQPSFLGAPACTAAEARFAERTDWLGPDPARCFDCPVDPAPAEQ